MFVSRDFDLRRQLLRMLRAAGIGLWVAPVGQTALASTLPQDSEASMQCTNDLSVMHRYADALRAGDKATAIAQYHDQLTLHWFGHRLAGDYVGKESALKILGEFSRRTHRKFAGVPHVMVGPDRSAMITREVMERNGKVAEIERALIFSIKDDRLYECWVYDSDPKLVDQFLDET